MASGLRELLGAKMQKELMARMSGPGPTEGSKAWQEREGASRELRCVCKAGWVSGSLWVPRGQKGIRV